MNVRARVVALRDLTHDVRLITLTLIDPVEMAFEPGQFVSFSVPMAGATHGVTRPYSMASSPADRSTIDLLLNLVPGGPGSTYLFGLAPGDEVTFKGPAGMFVLREYPDRHLLFVATGTGIAPIRSMLLARLPSPRPVTLIWGLRAERDLYFQAELAALAARHPEFSFALTLSQAGPDWPGARGYVQPLIEQFIAERGGTVDDLAVYACGGSQMLRSVVGLIRDHGVCPIHREQYYKDAPAPSE